MFSSFSDVEAYLNSLINYESRLPLGGRDWPKLEPTREAVLRLGLSFSLSNCIHVAGTKGKGSVVSLLEVLLSARHRVLSFTSPHLVSIRERIRLNGEPLDEPLWCEGFSAIVPALNESPQIKLTYFESTFIFYLWAARHLNTDVHLVEAGLGGRWDATNVLEDTLAVLTLVDYDHMDILGKTLTEIARDKAGIIKANSRVVVSRQTPEALHVYEQAIEAGSASASYFDRDFAWTASGTTFTYRDSGRVISGLTLTTPGVHQLDNAAVAIRAALSVDRELPDSQIRDRLAECVVPGRQQLLRGRPDVIVDVAHNPASFVALAETLRTGFAGRRILGVVGMMKDKDARTCFDHLRGVVSQFLVVTVNSPRAFPAEALAQLLRNMGAQVTVCPSPEAAFEHMHGTADHDLGLVAGSFYLAGDYLTWRKNAGIA